MQLRGHCEDVKVDLEMGKMFRVCTFENLTWSYTYGVPEQNSAETKYPPEHEIRYYISIE